MESQSQGDSMVRLFLVSLFPLSSSSHNNPAIPESTQITRRTKEQSSTLVSLPASLFVYYESDGDKTIAKQPGKGKNFWKANPALKRISNWKEGKEKDLL